LLFLFIHILISQNADILREEFQIVKPNQFSGAPRFYEAIWRNFQAELFKAKQVRQKHRESIPGDAKDNFDLVVEDSLLERQVCFQTGWSLFFVCLFIYL
jgi:hypothetical protein